MMRDAGVLRSFGRARRPNTPRIAATMATKPISVSAMRQSMVHSTITAPTKSTHGGRIFQISVLRIEPVAPAVAVTRLPSEPAMWSAK